MLRAPLTYRRLSERAGSEVQAACHHPFRSVSRATIGRYLSFPEREEIALLRARGCTMREAARQLGRSPSTISREVRRNAATRSGGLDYRATAAQWHSDRSASRPKWAKLTRNSALQAYVEERLAGRVEGSSGLSVRGPT